MKANKQPKKFETEKTGSVEVKIYKRTRKTAKGETRTIWEVVDYTQGIRRLRGFSDHADAHAEAKRIADTIASGNAAGAEITNREAASFGRALELIRPTGAPLELVAAHYAEAFKILGGDKIIEAAREFVRRNPTARPPRTVAKVAEELIELKTNRKAGERYLEDLRTRMDTFAKRFVSVNVDAITASDVQAWLDSLKSAPRTVKNFRNTVNSLFKFAETRGYIGRGENPVSGTEKIETRNGEAITIYTPEELARLIDAAPESFKPVIAIQAFAGLRSAEVMRLDWHDVKLAKGFIELSASKAKTASRRLAPITANLAAWLEDHAKKKGAIFPHSKAYFHELQRNISAATEIKADAANGITAQKPVEWKRNALRHSFISYRVSDIQDVAKVALEAGNSPAMIFSNYRELVDPSASKAWFAIVPTQPANVIQLKAAAQ